MVIMDGGNKKKESCTALDIISESTDVIETETNQETNILDIENDNLNDNNLIHLNFSKMLIHLYLKIVIRMTDKSNLPKMHKLISKLLAGSVKLSVWLIDNMTEKNAIRDFLVDCPVMDMKYMTCGLIKVALQTICANKTPEP